MRKLQTMIMVGLACGCATEGGNASDGAGSTSMAPTTSTESGGTSSATHADDSTGTGATTGSTSSGESGATTGDTGGIIAECGLVAPCDWFSWQCNPSQPADCADVPYGDALVCMLGALAAGDEAQLHINFDSHLSGEVEWLDIASPGGGAAAVRQYGMTSSEDLDDHYEAPATCTLRSADFFTACLADDAGADQHAECMDPYAWFEGDCAPANACP